MQPIDYTIQVQQPFVAALQGYKAGATVRDDQYELQQREQAQQQQLQMRRDVGALIQNRNATPADFAAMAMKYPAMKDSFKQANDMLSAEQKQSFVSHGAQVYSALAADRPEVAKKLLTERATAMRNSGNEKGAKDAETMLGMIDIDPAIARNATYLTLSSLDDKFADAIAKRGAEDRATQQAPADLRAKVAGADKAEAEATTAGVTAKFAEQKAQSDLETAAASLGLTKAQTAQAAATTRKLNVETQQAIADAAAGGDPGKRFDAETKLRKEYSDQTKGFQEVSEAYRRVKAASNDGPGDIALIYGYMKMLDPGSVVREGEFATASNSGGIPASLQNLYNKALSGQRLTEGQRKTFTAQAGKLADAAGKREQEVRAGLSTVVKNYRLNPDNVFGTAIQAEAPAPSPAAAGQRQAVRIQTDADYNALPSGATFIAPDGTTRRKP